MKTEGIGFSVKTDVLLQVVVASTQRFRDRSTLSCTHCHRQGHKVTECFQVHGYPEWFYKQNRVTRPTTSDVKPVQRGGHPARGTGRGCGLANNAHAGSSADNGSDQIAQLISLLQAQRPSTSSEKLSGKTKLMM